MPQPKSMTNPSLSPSTSREHFQGPPPSSGPQLQLVPLIGIPRRRSRTSSNWHRHRCTDALCTRHPPARQRTPRNLTPQPSRSRRRADERVTGLTRAKPGPAQRGRAMSRCDRSQPLPPPLSLFDDVSAPIPARRAPSLLPQPTSLQNPRQAAVAIRRNPPDWAQETLLQCLRL
ncbi:hypothetical protein HETIRDRAFT_441479 [Heterobasidion irregulare TC 32-1]|uniref:Uncharacterized protein n=1 Tax=Heterobasidion irregulare (strain TC 32-1) TaxID=747525 RepID=W4JYR7_HETIT|nr:uncharacterized protein HETIRDRAFT_441479 [Heterobasidion irregulare TC 32-1]ETW78011.1 hypothetical protein HETIRDRAFT_441479 [Heterobasidion irregulare TC 32-1]